MLSALLFLSVAVANDGKISADELVRRLGDESFRVRDAAARELLTRGKEGVDALKRGEQNPDLEIRERCRRLLGQLRARLIRERLEIFVGDVKAAPDPIFPAADRFLALAGAGKAARELYVEVLRDHQVLLEALAHSPKEASDLCRGLCKSLQDRARPTGRRRQVEVDVTRTELAAILFASADSRITLDSLTIFHRGIALKSGALLEALGNENDPLRQLFLSWLEREADASTVAIGLELAATAQMKEATAVALKIAADSKRPPIIQATALVFLPRVGDKDSIKLIAGLLDNKSPIASVTFADDRPRTTVELGDVALGVSIALAGHDPLDFGFDIRRATEARSYVYYGFSSPIHRAAAHAQWRKLLAKTAP